MINILRLDIVRKTIGVFDIFTIADNAVDIVVRFQDGCTNLLYFQQHLYCALMSLLHFGRIVCCEICG